MSKKDRMLAHITNNVNWFMPDSISTAEVIPYYELSVSVFERAKQYFASDAEYSDVVCLISTSILETGKSGILFTTNYVYSKAWGGIFTSACKNWIFSSYFSEFDVINEFNTERMMELMSDLADISLDEDDKKEKLERKAASAVGAIALGGMILADIVSTMGDNIVFQNNESLANEIANLENSSDEQTRNVMYIYKDFIPLINQFVEIIVNNDETVEMDEDTCILILKKINEILIVLYNQASSYANVTIDDDDEYDKFGEWIVFWALMFYDAEQFREVYSLEILQEMPECWKMIAEFVDSFLEAEDCKKSFSNVLADFADTVIDNVDKSSELLSNSEWDEDFVESMVNLAESNIRATDKLVSILDETTDYLIDFLKDE